jgi:glutamate dehydrogenase
MLVGRKISDDKYLDKFIIEYFPSLMGDKFKGAILSHILKDEIIATVLVNEFVNYLGCTFFHQLIEEDNTKPENILKAFVIAMELYNVKELWQEVEKIPASVPLKLKLRLFHHIQSTMGRNISWLLTMHKNIDSIEDTLKLYKDGIVEVQSDYKKFITPNIDEEFKVLSADYEEYPEISEIVEKVIVAKILRNAVDIVHVAKLHKKTVSSIAPMFYKIGDELYIRWMIIKSREFVPNNYIQLMAIREQINELQRLHIEIVKRELKSKGNKEDSVIKPDSSQYKKLKMFVKENKRSMDSDSFISTIAMGIKYLNALLA